MPKDNNSRKRAAVVSRVSPNAYYSGSKTSSQVTQRARPRRAKRFALKGLDAFALIILVSTFLYSLSVSSRIKLTVDDQTYHSAQQYQQFVASQITHLKNRNKITFDQNAISSAIISHFPEVKTVNIELPVFSNKPTVRLAVGAPKFAISSGGQSLLVSSNGTAVGLVSHYKNLPNLINIKDQSGFNVRAGQPVLSIRDIGFVQTIVAQLDRRAVPIKEFILPASPSEIDLYTDDQAYYTKFYMGGDANLQAGQFLAARNTFTDTNQPSQYLDVRVAGKVFYK